MFCVNFLTFTCSSCLKEEERIYILFICPYYIFVKDRLYICWLLAKNLSNFVSLPCKLHNRYCHNLDHHSCDSCAIHNWWFQKVGNFYWKIDLNVTYMKLLAKLEHKFWTSSKASFRRAISIVCVLASSSNAVFATLMSSWRRPNCSLELNWIVLGTNNVYENNSSKETSNLGFILRT